jgi:hypothetical protein
VVETVDPIVGPQLTAEARRRLEVLPDYVFVLDASGRALYMSAAARRLETADLQTVLDAAAQRVQVGNYSLKLTLRRTEVLLAAQRRRPPGRRWTGWSPARRRARPPSRAASSSARCSRSRPSC